MRETTFRGFSILALAGASIMALAAPTAATAQQRQSERRSYDIAAQDLAAALEAFGRQSGKDIMFDRAVTAGKRSSAVRGRLDAGTALRRLLAGTGLSVRDVNGNAFVVEHPAVAEAFEDEGEVGDAEIVVTGSRIRGVQPASPVITISQSDMRQSGHNNLGEALRAVPQNFNGGQNPGVLLGATAGGLSNNDITGSSGLNLRGLGPDATLTLLNGTRFAYDGFSQVTDISVIPAAAIERIEILLDGASAVYGTDAVGGVANVILKRDFQGGELSARYGAATDGGFEQQQYSAVLGQAWSSGGFILTGDYSKNTAITADQREYLSYLSYSDGIDIYPSSTQKGVLLSGHQTIFDGAEISVDAFYTDRKQDRQAPGSATIRVENEGRSKIWGFAPSFRFELPGNWDFRVVGVLGGNKVSRHTQLFSASSGARVNESDVGYANTAQSAGIEMEGPLFKLPGGEARGSFGGGYRRNTFKYTNLLTDSVVVDASASSYYGYGEVNLPLISPDMNVPFVSKLTLNGALRYEKYDTFGETTTPRAGILWGLSPDFDVKANWGKSFKIPTLLQQFSVSEIYLQTASSYGGPIGPTALLTLGGNPDLDPERATVITAGVALHPRSMPGFKLEISWFDIKYTDRVVQPITNSGQALANPAYVQLITLAPTLAEQSAAFAGAGLPVGSFTANYSGTVYDPQNVTAIVHNRYVNAAGQRAHGFDVTASYVTAFISGQLSLSGNAGWIDATRQLTSLAPDTPASGVVFFPATFRGRLGCVWTKGELTLASHINHISGVRNTNLAAAPRGGTMTTLDLVGDYQFAAGPLDGVGFNLAILNLFDARPPFMQPAQPFHVNYDSTNYSGIGRTISITLTKRF